MSPTSRSPGAWAVKSRSIRSGLPAGCPSWIVVRLWARGLDGPQAQFPHQIGDQPDAGLDPLAVELGGHPPAPRGLLGLGEDPDDLNSKLPAPGRGRGLDPSPPGIATGPGHTQEPAHPPDRIGGLLRLDQRAAFGYCGVRAKKPRLFSGTRSPSGADGFHPRVLSHGHAPSVSGAAQDPDWPVSRC